jgi:hypothetical protein
LNSFAYPWILNYYDHLLKFGIESKEALSYRLLTEEKLLEYIKKGKTGEKLCVRLVSKLDDFHVNLRVGDEDGDIFMIPSSGDSISQQIFHNILRSL